MCGLVGIAGNLTTSEEDVFKHLFLQNALRGIHGCGLFYQTKKVKEPVKSYFMKSEEPSSTFVFSDEYKSTLRSHIFKSLLGHSRHATKGEITKENCHPFNNKFICGMHNGTITGKWDYTDKYDTDSEALFHNIAEKGLKETLEYVEDKSFNCAYALQYFDGKEETINIIRNKERPLYYAYNKEKDITIWASEKEFFLAALERKNMRKGFVTHELKPGDLLQIYSTNDDYKPYITKNFHKPKERTYTYYNYGNYNNPHYAGPGWWKPKKKEKSELEFFKVGKVIWQGKAIEKEYLNENPCTLCGVELTTDDCEGTFIVKEPFDYFTKKDIICPDCIQWWDKTELSKFKNPDEKTKFLNHFDIIQKT